MSGSIPDPSGEAFMRWLWFAAGWLMVALGFIGAILPVMPTTIFLIMAVGCFARSSPRFERWLLEHPQFGRPLRQWREEGAISRKGRRMAFAGMAAGYVIFWIGARPSWLLALGVALFFVLGAAYVGTRPLPRQERGAGKQVRVIRKTASVAAAIDALQAA